MKYEQTMSVYELTIRKTLHEVVPFNAETEKFFHRGSMINDVSWSHGFTHLKTVDDEYVGFVGVDYFEKNAKLIKELA
jgi:hypothetical protein